MRLARILGALGRACIAAGVLILLFVAYQLWGTGIREARAQDRLKDDFTAVLEAGRGTEPTASTTTSSLPSSEEPSDPVDWVVAVDDGEPTARIRIPAIGVDKVVVEGVSLTVLKDGPGHFPETPLPGQAGNAAIAGHRTTYGAPFNRLDELESGDEIRVETVQGEFSYLVTETSIVAPTAVEVLEDKGDNRLTLTACHPKYSARERIVVVAELAAGQDPAPRPTREGEPSVAALDDLDGDGAAALPAVLLGLLCATIWVLAWLLSQWWRRWLAYLVAMPLFLVSLFLFFEEFSRLLPASY